jgi:hypothetical protein
MDEEEYQTKYTNLRVLKSIQDYLKVEGDAPTSVYPVRMPDDFLYQVLKNKGAEQTDELVHQIFRLGLKAWSERLYTEVFGSEESLEAFIELVKKREGE